LFALDEVGNDNPKLSDISIITLYKIERPIRSAILAKQLARSFGLSSSGASR
jgi:hypothetical protein